MFLCLVLCVFVLHFTCSCCLGNLWEFPPRPPDSEGELGLSPPSESRLLQRRKSLQIARFSSTEVIKIQVNPTTQNCGTKALFGQLRLWAFEIAAVGFFSCRVSCWSGAKFKKRCVITLILLKHVKLKLCMLSVNVCSTWTSLSLFLWKLKPEPTKKMCSDSRLLVQIWIFSHFLAFCVLLRTTVYRTSFQRFGLGIYYGYLVRLFRKNLRTVQFYCTYSGVT